MEATITVLATTTVAPDPTAAPPAPPTVTPPGGPWFQVQSWTGGCMLTTQLIFTDYGSDWTLVLRFQQDQSPTRTPEVWNGRVADYTAGVLTIVNEAWNGFHTAGDALAVGMNLVGPSSTCFPLVGASLNGVQLTLDGSGTGATSAPTPPPSAVTAAPINQPGSSAPTTDAPQTPTQASPTAAPPPTPVSNATCPPPGWASTCPWPPLESAPCCSQYGWAGASADHCSNGGIDSRSTGCCSTTTSAEPLSCTSNPSQSSSWTCISNSGSDQNTPTCTGDAAVDAVLYAADMPAVTGMSAPSSVYTWGGFCAALRQLHNVRGTISGIGGGDTLGVSLGMRSMSSSGTTDQIASRNRVLANIASLLAQAAWESGGDSPWSFCDENNYIHSPTASCTQRSDGTLYSSLTSAISCPVDMQMHMVAETYASWAVQGPMRCDPGTSTAGCCWWGRGAIQTTGPHNYAALQTDVISQMSGQETTDLCTNPEAICQDDQLIWIGALYYWTSVVQTDSCFNSTLNAYADSSGFHPCASVTGCLSFNRGTGGKVNNGQWNAPAHGESGRIRAFERYMGAINDAIQRLATSPTVAPTSPTPAPSMSPSTPPTSAAPVTIAPTEAPSTRAPSSTPTEQPTLLQTAAPTAPVLDSLNFAEAIRLSLLFYDAQRTGALPTNVRTRVPWRRDAFLQDGADAGLDLTGGFFDAGDYVKFGFPAASAMTLLAWSAIDFSNGYQGTERAHILDTLRWFADYAVRCYPNSTIFFGQVGNGVEDHAVMCRPDECVQQRPSYSCSASAPCSDLAAETAAALAAIAIVFNQTDTAYANSLAQHAESLYAFATMHRGLYQNTITDAAAFYPSSDDTDEMGWGAAWLYRATGTSSYLVTAERFATSVIYQREQSWDNKGPGLAVLLYRLTRTSRYRQAAVDFMNGWLPGGRVQYTPQGLAWLRQWGPLRYTSNTAFIGLAFAAELMRDNTNNAMQLATTYQRWGRQQIGYMLGNNSAGFSYLVGFGDQFPRQPHHKSSVCAPAPAACTWATFSDTSTSNHFLLLGALVGGPSLQDQYTDDRTDYIRNEVALDYNAGFTAALAALESVWPSPSSAPTQPTAAPTRAPSALPTSATPSATPTPRLTVAPSTHAPTYSGAGTNCFEQGDFSCNATSSERYVQGYNEQWCTSSCYIGGQFHPACVAPDLPGMPDISTCLHCVCTCHCNGGGSTSTPPSVSSTVAPTDSGVSGLSVSMEIENIWPQGCQVAFHLFSSQALSDWTVSMSLEPSAQLTDAQVWSATMNSLTGNVLTVSKPSWMTSSPANSVISFGAVLSGSSATCFSLSGATVNGVNADVGGGSPGVPSESPTGAQSTAAPTSSGTTSPVTASPVNAPTPSLGSNNPFVEYPNWFVPPSYATDLNETIAVTTDPSTRCTLESMRDVPSAFWIDVKAKTVMSASARSNPNMAHGILENARVQGGKLVTFIIYDLPNRDCAAHASNGEICCSYNGDGTCDYLDTANECATGLDEYKRQYIDPLSTLFQAYPDVPKVLVIEPDSLPNLATNLGDARCANTATQASYVEGIRYAVQSFASIPNVTVYLDGAHGGWLGWPNNANAFASIVSRLGVASLIRGFATNVANYQPLGEQCTFPVGSDPTRFCAPGGAGAQHSCCTADPCGLASQFNSAVHELNYVVILHYAMSRAIAGFDPHFLIDTGRNGVNGPRSSCSNWCNIRGAGIGRVPTTAGLPPKIDALLWLKTPGESDGCSATLPSGGNCPRYDVACGSVDSLGSRTGEPLAPEAGQWYTYQIQQLAANAHTSVTAGGSCTSTTDSPSEAPVTASPTEAPSTASPTEAPSTASPTEAPSTASPTEAPSTASPTSSPATLSPTHAPSTLPPTTVPATCGPGTVLINNVCSAVCGQGTRLNTTLNACVPDCNAIRRRSSEPCSYCDQNDPSQNISLVVYFPGDLSTVNVAAFTTSLRAELASRFGVPESWIDIQLSSGSVVATVVISSLSAEEHSRVEDIIIGVSPTSISVSDSVTTLVSSSIIMATASPTTSAITTAPSEPPTSGRDISAADSGESASSSSGSDSTVAVAVGVVIAIVVVVALVIALLRRKRNHGESSVPKVPRAINMQPIYQASDNEQVTLRSKSRVAAPEMHRISFTEPGQEMLSQRSASYANATADLDAAPIEERFVLDTASQSLRLKSVRRTNPLSTDSMDGAPASTLGPSVVIEDITQTAL